MTGRRTADLLAATADRLIDRYGDIVPPETIRHVVNERYQSLLSRSTITSYLPVLVERSVESWLVGVAAGPGDDSAPSPEP